ncbi:MAG TPA: sigma-70 family RNA polymerase sigma factor [Actinomycetota bacterium]|nr:sigma-70 family RNA polymerase sigma factor [Actinomycetota bacterium]
MGTAVPGDHALRVDEDELLQAVARGDVDALRALYRSFERPLYALGIRWLNDPKLAEELVQEVTLRVWRRAGRYDPERGASSSWIFGIARNVAADLARARSKTPIPVPEAPEEVAPWDEDRAWTAWEVARAVARLPEDQRRVVELAYANQMTQSEIASELRIPLGTVKTRLYAALRKLRGIFAERGIDAGGAA